MIIAIGYKKQVGKDSFYKIVKDAFPALRIQRRAFADAVKFKLWSSLYEEHGFDISILDNPNTKSLLRPGMSSYANFIRNFVDKYYWADQVLDDLTDINTIYIITDMRYPEEKNKIENLGGLTINVIRDSTNDGDQDPSEISLDNHQFNYVIENNGSYEEYEKNVIELFKKMYNNNDAS